MKKTHESRTSTVARILFEHGRGLVRGSNTQPVLVMRFEADSEKHLEEISKEVDSNMEALKAAT